jgi:hypothetical protein
LQARVERIEIEQCVARARMQSLHLQLQRVDGTGCTCA